MANNTETKHKRPFPILMENNFLEWRRRTIGLLRQKKLYVPCIKKTIPSLSSETRPSTADNKIIDANIETCNITTNSLDSSTFSEIAVGDEERENTYLFLIEKVILNTKTQGSPDAILNLLHDAALKEEALKSSFDTNIDSRMALNRETFRSKTIHYCNNGRHNPLASHPPEKCWKLHPKKQLDRYQKDAKTNYTFARALLTIDKNTIQGDVLNVVLDTGASDHMFNNKSFFLSLNKINNSTISMGCDSSSLTAIGKGTAKLINQNGVCWTLKNSLYVPKLNTNLVALSQLASQIILKSTDENVKVFLNNATTPLILCPTRSKVLETKVKLDRRCLSTRNQLWHQRLGHLNGKATKALIPTYKAAGEVCNECVKGKLTGIPFSHSFQTTSYALQVVHMDLCGSMHTQLLSGTRYFLILIDQFTGYTTTKFQKQKEETFVAFKEYKAWAENLHQRKIIKIVSDGGGEFVNDFIKEYARIEGFEHSISPPYTPENNGIAERGNRSILEKARCLMLQSKLTDQFWAEATSTATFLLNVAPKCNKISPYKKWFHQELPVSNLKTFGCKAWVIIPPIKRQSKFELIVWEGIIEWEEEFHNTMEEIPQRRIRVIGPRHLTLITGDVSEENILLYQRRAHQTVESNPIPNNYQQAIKSKDSDKWEGAISKELDNMKKLKVWTIRDRTPEDHPITCTWVFKIKEENKKRVIEHKAFTKSKGWITRRLSLPLAKSAHYVHSSQMPLLTNFSFIKWM
ncbi:hypothetical protein O181_023540 [Austropuccinia psidii MF-1]|uniref:Integrase catalytic domain-containing protein n=1 Tax=Austropuccinia psidii MF-1 TaxID=1389203 RepID=A0A9Q3CJA0_9BASI|nr:hypothetical protein [Austropuccinia psidii MF-1]